MSSDALQDLFHIVGLAAMWIGVSNNSGFTFIVGFILVQTKIS